MRPLLFLTLLASTLHAADWPHFLGQKYDGSSPETGLLHELPADGPRKLWEFAKGAGHSAPAVAGGRVVVFHARGAEEILDCLDAATGAVKWTHRYAAEPGSRYGAGAGPRTNPVIDGGRVFSLGVNAVLHGLDLATGAVLWRRDLDRDEKRLETFFGAGGTPLVAGGRVIVPLGTEDKKSLVALDAATGREVWAARHEWGASYSSPVPARLHGRDVVLALQGGMSDPPTGGLLVVDVADGKVLASVPFRARMFASVSISSPVAVGNRVFVADAYTEGGLCVEIAPDFTAKAAWRAPKFGTYLMTAAAHEGALYGFAGQHQQNAEFAAYDMATGRELWRDDLGGKFQRGTLLRADGAFLCLGESGDLAWLDLTPKGAVVKSHAKLFHAPESWTPPALSDGRLFICQNQPGSAGTKPRVICYELRAAQR